MYTPYREAPKPKPANLDPNQIDPRCEFMQPKNLQKGRYERQFAEMWVHCYPDIDLYTQVRLTDETRHLADFIHLESGVIVEIDGGVYMRRGNGGGHGAGGNYRKDMIAAYRGFVVVRFTSNEIKKMHKDQEFSALELVYEIIQRRTVNANKSRKSSN